MTGCAACPVWRRASRWACYRLEQAASRQDESSAVDSSGGASIRGDESVSAPVAQPLVHLVARLRDEEHRQEIRDGQQRLGLRANSGPAPA